MRRHFDASGAGRPPNARSSVRQPPGGQAAEWLGAQAAARPGPSANVWRGNEGDLTFDDAQKPASRCKMSPDLEIHRTHGSPHSLHGATQQRWLFVVVGREPFAMLLLDPIDDFAETARGGHVRLESSREAVEAEMDAAPGSPRQQPAVRAFFRFLPAGDFDEMHGRGGQLLAPGGGDGLADQFAARVAIRRRIAPRLT